MRRVISASLWAVFGAAWLWSGPQEPVIRVETETIRVPVAVIGKKGEVYTELTEERFVLMEDGVRQEITSFIAGESPLTLILLLEYSGVVGSIRGEVIRPAGVFVTQVMGPLDYVALLSFDIRPRILSDFTNQPYRLLDAINSLVYSPPGFRESNLYDAVYFALFGGTLENVEYKGLSSVEGRTGLILIATGIDTFSRLSFDQARRAVESAGVPIYAVGVGEVAYIRAEPYLSSSQRLTFLQAQNTLRTFSESSGGRFYSVRFQGELDNVLESIATLLRHQYTLGYISSNPRREGKRRKLQVLVDVDGDGQPDNEKLDLQFRRYYVEPGGKP